MPDETDTVVRCSLLRRLAAIAYDGIVLIGVLFAAAIPPTVAMVALTESMQEESLLFRFAMTLYLLIAAFLFFGGFWTHGGQTIGMRAWRIRVVCRDGARLRWRDAALRFLGSIVSWGALGLGFFWSLFDRDQLTWHDRWSGTELRRTV
ncbi:MAG: RDD family protein [Halofilum sp. (in: g-proteobacteria)]